MRLITAVDSVLLQLTEKLVKRFNWLTGKDNFYLARGVAVLIIALSLNSFSIDGLDIISSILMLCLLLFLGTMSFMRISSEEKTALKESLKGIKHERRAERNIVFRVTLLLVFFEMFIFYTLSVSFVAFQNESTFRMLSLALLLTVFVFYLIAINKPPFKRSEAVQRLKSKIKSVLTVPVPVPIPVTG